MPDMQAKSNVNATRDALPRMMQRATARRGEAARLLANGGQPRTGPLQSVIWSLTIWSQPLTIGAFAPVGLVGT